MNEQAFKAKTKQLGLDVIKLLDTLPATRSTDAVSRQLVRAATSVGANYRAACRGKSRPDVIAKLGLVEEEADETLYWLELLVESRQISSQTVKRLMEEANEIVAMSVASIKTLRLSLNSQSKIQNPKSKI